MLDHPTQTIACPHENDLPSKFLIRLTLDGTERVDAWELCRAIEYLGGVETGDGFAFPTTTRRDLAAEILGEKYGMRYFRTVHEHGDDGAAKLLIAESDEKLAEDYRRFFTRKGFHVEVAYDGLHCWGILRSFLPHAAIIERELPWGGGDGVAARMGDVPQLSTIPVVLTSADVSSDDLGLRLASPIVACFQKPFRLSQLLGALTANLPTRTRNA